MNSKIASKTNEWYISEYEYVNWFIHIPAPKNTDGAFEILDLYKSWDILSRSNRIYMIDEIEGEFQDSENFHYIDHIEQFFLQKQELWPPGIGDYVGPSGDPEVSPTSTILTEICFYDEHGNIQSLKVNNIRKILQATYNYEMLEEWEIDGDIYNNDIHTLDISPIDIGGDYLSMEKVSNNTQSEIHIYISCKTDIWFPWIPYRYGGVFDNRELARCHTPRLNNFLSGVEKLVLDIGGTFEIDCFSSFYKKQLSQAGILLDCECPEWIRNPYSKY